jgi:hypothetical protein
MLSRRTWLKTTSSGFGYLAFAALANEQAARANRANANPLAPKESHFTPRAKRVIFLCMEGGPSHIDTFDYKPKLTADNGKTAPRGRGGFGGEGLHHVDGGRRRKGRTCPMPDSAPKEVTAELRAFLK